MASDIQLIADLDRLQLRSQQNADGGVFLDWQRVNSLLVFFGA